MDSHLEKCNHGTTSRRACSTRAARAGLCSAATTAARAWEATFAAVPSTCGPGSTRATAAARAADRAGWPCRACAACRANSLPTRRAATRRIRSSRAARTASSRRACGSGSARRSTTSTR